MGEDFIPEPGHLLKFVRKLREVFDVCDEDADGFIRLEHLLQLGSQFGQAEQVGVIDVCPVLIGSVCSSVRFLHHCTLLSYLPIWQNKNPIFPAA